MVFRFLIFRKNEFQPKGYKKFSIEYHCTHESTKSYGEKSYPFNFTETQFSLKRKGTFSKKF